MHKTIFIRLVERLSGWVDWPSRCDILLCPSHLLSTTKVPDFVAVDGIFLDPNHFEVGTWKGVRATVTGMGEVGWENLFLIGTDGGEIWFRCEGRMTSMFVNLILIESV